MMYQIEEEERSTKYVGWMDGRRAMMGFDVSRDIRVPSWVVSCYHFFSVSVILSSLVACVFFSEF